MVDSIILGDCLEVMPTLEGKSVDLILADLPYGCLNKKNPLAKWDNVIPFDALWEQYRRLLKPNGAVVLFAQGMFTARLMMSNPKWWRYNLVWDKGRVTGFLNARRQPMRSHEDICVFAPRQTVYNPQMVKCLPHQRNHTRGKQENPSRNRIYGNFGKADPEIISDLKYPRSIVRVPSEHKVGEFWHPTSKPVALCEWLIRTYTNEGDTVLDNVCGGGSSLVAAVDTNRHFIGIEKEREFYDISRRRVANARIANGQLSLEWPQVQTTLENFENKYLKSNDGTTEKESGARD